MVKKNKQTDGFKKIIQEKQQEIFDDLTKNYNQTVEHGKQFGKESLKKIDKIAVT